MGSALRLIVGFLNFCILQKKKKKKKTKKKKKKQKKKNVTLASESSCKTDV